MTYYQRNFGIGISIEYQHGVSWEDTVVFNVYCCIFTCGSIWAAPSWIPPVFRCVSYAGKRGATECASGACPARDTSTANWAAAPRPRTTESDTGPREPLRRGSAWHWTHFWSLLMFLSLRPLALSSPCRTRSWRNTWCVYSSVWNARHSPWCATPSGAEENYTITTAGVRWDFSTVYNYSQLTM